MEPENKLKIKKEKLKESRIGSIPNKHPHGYS
jgi:hypothetical protein